MHSSLIAWIMRAIPFGTIIMYGALGETVTEKSGNLNLGVPGIMYLGGFAGFASAWAYANTAANPNGLVSILIATLCAIAASMLGDLIYAFLTISLRANQNVTGLALTTFGKGVAAAYASREMQPAPTAKGIARPPPQKPAPASRLAHFVRADGCVVWADWEKYF